MLFPKFPRLNFNRNRRELFVWSGFFYLFSSLLFMVLISRYLSFVLPFESGLAKIYAPTLLLGQTFLIFLAFYLITACLNIVTGSARLVKASAVVSSSIFIIYLIVDFAVYSQYRFHLNKIVIDLLIGGGKEIFDFSASTIFYVVKIIVLVSLFQVLTAWISSRLAISPGVKSRYIFIPYVLVSLVCLLTFNVINAWADASFDRSITRFTRHIPLFYPLTAKKFFHNHGLVDSSYNRDEYEYKIRENTKGQLNYPAAPLRYKEGGNDLSVLFIVLDCFRFDMLTDSITPNISRFKKQHDTLNFTNHFSGGNGTRMGIFSLFYGIPGTYWNLVYAEQAGPLLMSEVVKRDYQTGIFASATLSRPPFDRTVFSEISDLRVNSSGNNVWERDENAVDEWLEWLAKADDSRPFFGFVFLDSPHNYVFPPDYSGDFGVVGEKMDYHKLNNQTDPTPIKNRFKKSVHYADSLVGKILDDLEEKSLIDNTVIVITGDHGQEFNENQKNFWGHGSNFTKYQIQVPLVISWPEKQEKTYNHLSTHFDVSATLMEDLFLSENDLSDFSSGQSLFNESERDWFVSGGFSKTAIVERDRITVSYETGTYEIFDKSNQELKSAKLRPEVLKEVFRELSKFN